MSTKKLLLISLLIVATVLVFMFFITSQKNSALHTLQKISVLVASDLQLSVVEGMKLRLAELGYKEGDLIFDIKNPKGDTELTKTLAAEIVASKPDLIISVSTSASRAVKTANESFAIPVVFLDVGNFRELGITNIQKPGGFMTGVVVDNVPVAPKRMDILKTLVPNMKKIAIIVNNKSVNYEGTVQAHEEGAEKLGISILWYKATNKEELSKAMDKLVLDRPDAFMTTSDAVISGNSDSITPRLKSAKIPSVDFNLERGIKSGYMMAYGVARFDVGKQGADMVNKVLRGERPGDVSIEFASNFVFEINTALAKEMGVSVPESLLLRANKIYNE